MKGTILALFLLGGLSWAWIYAGQQQARIASERRESRRKCVDSARRYEPVWLVQRGLDQRVSHLSIEINSQVRTQKDAVASSASFELAAKEAMFKQVQNQDIGGYVLGGNTDRGREASERHGQLSQSIDNLKSATEARIQARKRLDNISIGGSQKLAEAQKVANRYRDQVLTPIWNDLQKECKYVDDMKQMEARFSATN